MLIMLILLGCGVDTDAGSADTDTYTDTGSAYTDTDTDTGEPSADPMGLVGSWVVAPCPCDGQRSQGDCSEWVQGFADMGYDGAAISPTLDIFDDGSTELTVQVYWHDEAGVEQHGSLTMDGAWNHNDGVYTVDGAEWNVEPLGELLTVTCGSGAHSLVP